MNSIADGDCEQARERAIESLTTLTTADPATLATDHCKCGQMTARDWSRWAHRHVSHHLRQFGLDDEVPSGAESERHHLWRQRHGRGRRAAGVPR